MLGYLAPMALLLSIAIQQGTPSPSDHFRLVRSLSGPSGTVVGSNFVLDETRNRFVYPQDASLVVYLEWEGPAGKHTLTGLWKDPAGRIASISPDVQMQTETPVLKAYWVFHIAAGLDSGIWTLEVRIDGQPAGSHPFELVMPQPAAPKRPSLDEIYKTAGASLVWVHSLDGNGRRIDSASGFVGAPQQIVTAFQAIESANHLEIEFADGRKVKSEEIWTCDHLQDWALVKVDTGGAAPLRRAVGDSVFVGDRLITFNGGPEKGRVIGGVDIVGSRSVPGFGQRLQFDPNLTAESVGAPLLNLEGDVVGMIGGTVTPGLRGNRRHTPVTGPYYGASGSWNTAIPIALLPGDVVQPPRTLRALLDAGLLIPPVQPFSSFLYGGTAREISKSDAMVAPAEANEFTRLDRQVAIYSFWQRNDGPARGVLSAQIFDSANRVVATLAPTRIDLPSRVPVRQHFSLNPAALKGGFYRVDLLFDGRPVWRTYFRVVD